MAHLLSFLLGLCLVATPTWAGQIGQPTLPLTTLQVGSVPLRTELARTDEQKELGLMYRPKLGDNDGMLFFFDQEIRANFWMANTTIPLSIAFLDKEGRLLEIHDMQPLDRRSVRSDATNVRYALEVNQGWFDLNKIQPGVMVKPAGPSSATLAALRQTPR